MTASIAVFERAIIWVRYGYDGYK